MGERRNERARDRGKDEMRARDRGKDEMREREIGGKTK